MSAHDHVRSLQAVRQLLVDRRREAAASAIDYQRQGDKRWIDSSDHVAALQKDIDHIDKAIADEQRLAPSVYEKRGLGTV